MSLIIRAARVIDPEKKFQGVHDVLIEKGKIARIEKKITAGARTEIDGKGLALLPGLVDIHVHLRQPGREVAETFETGSRAALRGGFTSICAMPNTDPACDSEAMVAYIKNEARRVGLVNIYPIGAISLGRLGKQLSEIGSLKRAGAVALSDDGSPVMDAELMRRGMEYAAGFGLCVISHAEDSKLSAGGVMNEGVVSTRLGLRGIPNASESVMIARDLALAQLTGCHVHIAHVSTAQGCQMIARAHEQGVKISGEATPHHLALTDSALASYDTRFKMNPPLRTEADRESVQRAVASGALKAIATDHAPHADHEKALEFDRAPFGVIGLETALGVSIKTLVQSKLMNLEDVVHRLSRGPAEIVGLDKGRIAIGADADLVLVDLDAEWEVRADEFLSKSTNSPFIGWKLPARVTHTLLAGKVVYREGRIL